MHLLFGGSFTEAGAFVPKSFRSNNLHKTEVSRLNRTDCYRFFVVEHLCVLLHQIIKRREEVMLCTIKKS